MSHNSRSTNNQPNSDLKMQHETQLFLSGRNPHCIIGVRLIIWNLFYLFTKRPLQLTSSSHGSEVTWKAAQSENLGWVTSFHTLCSLFPGAVVFSVCQRLPDSRRQCASSDTSSRTRNRKGLSCWCRCTECTCALPQTTHTHTHTHPHTHTHTHTAF